jgi:dolichol-phosphate mannosyltransferase
LSQTDPEISIVLPAFNEAENVERAVGDAIVAASAAGLVPEVIVVDDGSTDGTGAALEMLLDRVPQLRVETHPRNLGYGCALRTGFAAAKADLVFYTDADNQFDLTELSRFMPAIGAHDIVVGFRIERADPRSRLIAAWVYNRMANALFRTSVRDVDCAFKLMRREALERLELVSREFFIDTEMIAKARALRMRVTEIGVTHRPRLSGETTVRASHVVHTLRDMQRMWNPIRRLAAVDKP